MQLRQQPLHGWVVTMSCIPIIEVRSEARGIVARCDRDRQQREPAVNDAIAAGNGRRGDRLATQPIPDGFVIGEHLGIRIEPDIALDEYAHGFLDTAEAE